MAPDGISSIGGSFSPGLNDSGLVAFHTTFNFHPLDDHGIYVGSGGPLTRIVRSWEAAPDGNGVYDLVDIIPSINNSGQVSMLNYLRGTTGGALDNQGIFVGSGGAVTQVARSGQAAPEPRVLFPADHAVSGIVAVEHDEFVLRRRGEEDLLLFADLGTCTRIIKLESVAWTPYAMRMPSLRKVVWATVTI